MQLLGMFAKFGCFRKYILFPTLLNDFNGSAYRCICLSTEFHGLAFLILYLFTDKVQAIQRLIRFFILKDRSAACKFMITQVVIGQFVIVDRNLVVISQIDFFSVYFNRLLIQGS